MMASVPAGDFSANNTMLTTRPNMLDSTNQTAAMDVYNSTQSNWTSDILTTSASIVAETASLNVYNSTQSNWTSDILTTSASIVEKTTALDVYNSTQSKWTSDILTTSASIVEKTAALDVYNSTQSNWTSDILTTTASIVEKSAELDIYNSSQSNWMSDILTTSASIVEDYKLPLAALWVYFTVRIIWGGLSLFGNSLTILVVAKFERLQTCTNYLICSLAFSDLLAVLLIPSMMILEFYPNSRFFIPTCLFEGTLSLLTNSGNILMIFYLSVDRYIYIAYPLRYHNLVTPKRTFIILGITWTFAVLTTPFLVFSANHLTVGMTCKYFLFLDNWVKDFYLGPQLILVILLTIGFNLAIAKIAHHQAVAIAVQAQPYDTLEIAVNQSTKKISRTLGMVLGVYLLSVIPQFILASAMPKHKYLVPWERFTNCMFWANSWVNPLIYTWRLKDFRIGYKKLLTGKGSFNEVP